MKRILMAGFVLLIGALPVRAQDTTSPWWAFVGADQKCEPSASPADWIRQYRSIQEGAHAIDTKDASGQVVSTQLFIPMNDGRDGIIYFFRGQDRCEQWVQKRDSSLNRYN